MTVAMKNTRPDVRTPERAALAAAIREHDDAAARLARVRQAKEEADEVRYRASAALTKAETAVEEAKQTEGARLAAVALGETDDTLSVADAELALVQATNDYAVTRNTIAALEARETAERRAVETALRARYEALHAAVKADPATHALVANYQAAQKHYLDLCKLLAALGDIGCCPLEQFGEGYSPRHNFVSQGTAPSAPAWLAAIHELQTNADAPLPQA
jgi:hypothetical protein